MLEKKYFKYGIQELHGAYQLQNGKKNVFSDLGYDATQLEIYPQLPNPVNIMGS